MGIKLLFTKQHWTKLISSHISVIGFILTSAGTALASLSATAFWFNRVPLWLFSLVASILFALTFLGHFIVLEYKNGKS